MLHSKRPDHFGHGRFSVKVFGLLRGSWIYQQFSSGVPALVYFRGHHQAILDKSRTYSVKAVNAELRHYLARLARISRCFSRCIHTLWCSVKLFVFAWNRRQLFKRAFPKFPAHVEDFVYP